MKTKNKNPDLEPSVGQEAAENASDGEPVEKREVWGSPAEFILSCLGYAVGLGNVWRFPYMVYENGGGAFLIPYVLTLIFIGIPAFFMELIMGQYSGRGPVQVWACAPVFQGIGVGMLFLNSMFCIFYTMILGYALYYLVLSFFNPLPWDNCQNDFNTPACYNKGEAEPCEKDNGTWYNRTCYNQTYLSEFDETRSYCNISDCYSYIYNKKEEELKNLTDKVASSTEEYLNLGVLQMSSGIEETGEFLWTLSLALLAGWIICFLCLLKGIRSSGKVVYFTAIFPYLVLTILLIYGNTLPGSKQGIDFYLKPDWSKLANAKVWADAASQIFFSLSIGGGGLMTFSSYNKFHNNIYRDALIISIGNCLTSFYAGFAIFSILGYMAFTLGKDVSEVVADGSTLAFVAYPTAVARMPVSQLWSVLFFIMLVTLGLDSLFAGIEANITALIDGFPKLRRHKHWVALAMCTIFFLIGLPMATQAGIYWLNVIAYYATGWSLLIMGIMETTAIAWFYGAKNLRLHVKEMVGFSIGFHWWILWSIVTPLLLIAILVFSLYSFVPLSFGPYTLPQWAQIIGWLIALTPVFLLLLFMLIVTARTLCKSENKGLSSTEKLKLLFGPTPEWGPSYKKNDANPANEEIPPWSNELKYSVPNVHSRPEVEPSVPNYVPYVPSIELNMYSYENGDALSHGNGSGTVVPSTEQTKISQEVDQSFSPPYEEYQYDNVAFSERM